MGIYVANITDYSQWSPNGLPHRISFPSALLVPGDGIWPGQTPVLCIGTLSGQLRAAHHVLQKYTV